jgi:hypothetical protein
LIGFLQSYVQNLVESVENSGTNPGRFPCVETVEKYPTGFEHGKSCRFKAFPLFSTIICSTAVSSKKYSIFLSYMRKNQGGHHEIYL